MSDKNYSGGASGPTILQIAFIVLKLCKAINWSWWWVLSPLWIGVCIVVILATIVVILNRRGPRLHKPIESEWQRRIREMKEKKKLSEKN